MAVYKRGKTYWFELVFQGERIRKSTHLSNLRKAEEYERGYRTALVKGENWIARREKKRADIQRCNYRLFEMGRI